jgi:2-polyprenyl-3-methyl-5-hydroxy-6-metoxy-1,4-benzoquinol methylase
MLGTIQRDMSLIAKMENIFRGIRQRWGTSSMKRALWNREFSNGRWDFIENTSGDVIYEYIEKYCRNGSILDLGCGSGNTGCELNADKYGDYTGVDISDVAIEKAIRRSEANYRDKKNHYRQSDITTYCPLQQYDVILFRESIYYIPHLKVKSVLDHYVKFLKPDGVFIVRRHDRQEEEAILDLLGDVYVLVEEQATTATSPTIIVFRPKTGAPA